MFEILSLVLEIPVAIVAIILIFFAFLYGSSSFIEERMKTITTFTKYLTCTIIGLSLLLPFTRFFSVIFFMVLLANTMWAVLLFRGFPYINMATPDFVIAFMGAIFSNVLFMVYYLQEDTSSIFETCSYFSLFVWSVPALVLSSLAAIDQGDESKGIDFSTKNSEGEEKKETTKQPSVIKQKIEQVMKKIESFLPYSGDKLD